VGQIRLGTISDMSLLKGVGTDNEDLTCMDDTRALRAVRSHVAPGALDAALRNDFISFYLSYT